MVTGRDFWAGALFGFLAVTSAVGLLFAAYVGWLFLTEVAWPIVSK